MFCCINRRQCSANQRALPDPSQYNAGKRNCLLNGTSSPSYDNPWRTSGSLLSFSGQFGLPSRPYASHSKRMMERIRECPHRYDLSPTSPSCLPLNARLQLIRPRESHSAIWRKASDGGVAAREIRRESTPTRHCISIVTALPGLIQLKVTDHLNGRCRRGGIACYVRCTEYMHPQIDV